ncbi:copper resistance CopC family protein [Microbacterium sp. SA39]|uniref:copper resistance CopC family protein n=1 Tax=Microbacterium sp. SA39 TaxID=1263625 RepID=UPI0005F9B8C3|nr:copper resistance CopC family protein [Microbacterium sp. SA39]KJQ53871.1 Copper resistance protein C precursor [Microbacterium sp. SA39]
MPTTTRRGRAIAAASALLIFLAVGAGASPAFAHESLVSSSPAEGEQLAAPPEQITLVFSDSVLTMGAEVVINDTSGRNWVEGAAAINGSTVIATVAEGMPAGDYEVIWKVVSGDGHPISALIPFSVLAGSPTPTPTPTASAAPGPTASATAADGDPDITSTEAETTGVQPWQFGLIIASVIVIGGGLCIAILLLMRRRRARDRSTNETSNE